MNDRCWYETNINFDPHFSLEKLPVIGSTEYYKQEGIWKKPISEIFSKEWIDYVDSIGLELWKSTLLFYRRPNYYAHRAHVDIQTICCGINWIIGGEDSEMIWYKLPEGEHKTKTSIAGTPYLSWPTIELEEIGRHKLSTTKLTLVRVDIPHAILVKSKDRWCISVRPISKQFELWDDTVDYLLSKKLLVDNNA